MEMIIASHIVFEIVSIRQSCTLIRAQSSFTLSELAIQHCDRMFHAFAIDREGRWIDATGCLK